MQAEQKAKKMRNRTASRRTFALLVLGIPLVQFFIFYIYVNFNSILMAFRKYSIDAIGGGYNVDFAGFANFKDAFDFLFSSYSGAMLVNSLKLYACNLIIVMGLALIFSYYIAKKFPLAGFFRVILYLPHIVSGVVLAVLYRYIVTDLYIFMVESLTGETVLGLIDDVDQQYNAILFYNIWHGFGLNVMLFTNAMAGINTSIIESAKLDGANVVEEFIYIYIPSIFPTFITFIVTGLAALFTNQMALYAFFGDTGKNVFSVFGFYLYVSAKDANYIGTDPSYPMLSALGLIITFVVAPLTLGVRKLLTKYGPRTD